MDYSNVVSTAVTIIVQVQKNIEAFEYAKKRAKILEEVCSICLVTLQATENARKRADALDLPVSRGVQYALKHLLDQIMVMQKLLEKVQGFSRVKWIAMGASIREDMTECSDELRACNTECFQVMQSWTAIINEEEKKRQYMIPEDSVKPNIEAKQENATQEPKDTNQEDLPPEYAHPAVEPLVVQATIDKAPESDDQVNGKPTPDLKNTEVIPDPEFSPASVESNRVSDVPSPVLSETDLKSPEEKDDDGKREELLKEEGVEEDQRMQVSEEEMLIRFLAMTFEFSELVIQVHTICSWRKDRDITLFKNKVSGYMKAWEPVELKDLKKLRTAFRAAVKELIAAEKFEEALLKAVAESADVIQQELSNKGKQLKEKIAAAGLDVDFSFESEIREASAQRVKKDIETIDKRQKDREQRIIEKERRAKEKASKAEERKRRDEEREEKRQKMVEEHGDDWNKKDHEGGRRGSRRSPKHDSERSSSEEPRGRKHGSGRHHKDKDGGDEENNSEETSGKRSKSKDSTSRSGGRKGGH
jgi:hypothetical protein